jgi:signal transduction histidine kinase
MPPMGPQLRAPVSGKGRKSGKRVESRWRLRNWRLRTKVIAVVTVPTLAALVLGGLAVEESLDEAAQFRQTVSQVDLANNVTRVIHELQKERTLSVARIAANRSGPRAGLDAQVLKVDREVAALSEAAGQVETSDNAARERYNRGLQRLSGLQALRNAADNSAYPDTAVNGAYSSMIESLVQLGREVNTAVNDRDLLRRGSTIQSVSEAKEFLSRENSALAIAAARNGFPTGLLQETRDAEASFGASVSGYLANATAAERQFFSDTFSGPEIDNRERIEVTALNRADADLTPNIPAEKFLADSVTATDRLRQIEAQLLNNLSGAASSLADDATGVALSAAGAVLGALVLALMLMLIVTRSLLKPLRVLRTNALDVAYTRLPETVQRILAAPDPIASSRDAVEPVPVFTREETGEVARSFDAVHEQAVRMAAEQALLRDNVNSIFVNLSRRSQALVERQLNLIDRLEQDEQDPDQLASLFELDHLATRMRRNSESLLVLSGSGLSRQLTRPVPVADVVGAAVSEVEQYARVEVLSAPEVAVQGRAVSDLVHLIAELLDNATTYSEPEKKVNVRMMVTRKKELAVQITDYGVGMSPADIEAANRRLADPPDMDVSVTRRMGLYVVARLAQRHDIQVRLRDNEDIEGGLIARIVVPAALVQSTKGTSTGLISTGPQSLPPLSPMTDTGTQTGPRTGGIANAFTGGFPKPRTDPTGTGFTEQQQTGSLPTFAPMSTEPPAPRSNGVLGHDTPTESENSAVSLFGSPLPEDSLPSLSSTDRNGTGTSGTGGTPSRPEYDNEAPTERLPIYEAVLSQWFESGDDQRGSRTRQPDVPEEQAGATATSSQGQVARPWTPQPNEADNDQARTGSDTGWQSAGDEGWQAAQALLSPPTQETVTTSAGLPKRVPKAKLVPGSPSTRPDNAEQAQRAPLPPRSADAVRGRMSSFQQGVRRGRHALIDAYAGEQPSQGDSRTSEEQE